MTSLSKNVKFSIEKNTEGGSFVVRSKTESFNLEHIVDKDILSFYSELSKYGIVDTGILPLSGTGVLAIRSAGNHTQITFQHAPQINYINWGTYEGDKNAQTYLVAQPYRIWIGDTIDGNLYGARMFYSPHPITNANQPLYHLNLPNTNCKGYRGNGVGWQCLYHNEDWTKLPLNEKIVRFAERCSGVETFNDNNMSETDGPRFYQQQYQIKYEDNYSDFSYLWNPMDWQDKTREEGFHWVLNEDLWIPVLVTGLDEQSRHDENGVPLTLGMAMVGNYQAYYTDNYKPKPINALTRSDLSSSVTPDIVASWIMRSHNSAKISYVPSNAIDASEKHREEIVLKSPKSLKNNNEEEDENTINFICPISGDPCSTHEDDTLIDSLDNMYCSGCYEESTTYCENTDSTLPSNSDYVYYHSPSGEYYDVRGLDYLECPNCATLQTIPENENIRKLVYHNQDDEPVFCTSCAHQYLSDNHPEHNGSCSHCSRTIPVSEKGDILEGWSSIVKTIQNVYLNSEDEIIKQEEHYCIPCASSATQCPGGHMSWIPVPKLPVPIIKEVQDNSHHEDVLMKKNIQITHLCVSCANPDIWQGGLAHDQINQLSTLFSVVTKGEERFEYAYNNGILWNSPYVKDVIKFKAADEELPF